MVVDLDVKNLLNGFLYILDPWITEFNNLASIFKNDVVVLFVKIRFLVMCLILTELMSANQTAF